VVAISIQSDVDKVAKKLRKDLQRQIPFATSRAINDVAFDARKAESAATKRYFDRPTPWIQKGFRVKKSNKRNLMAKLFIPPDRWDRAMKLEVEGGVSGKSHAIPINARRNRYGGLSRTQIKNQINAKGAFVKEINGRLGVWKMQGRGKNKRLRLQVMFDKGLTYAPRFPFGKATDKAVRLRFPRTFDKRLRDALRTAR
jgi:hypothetical protein